MKKTIAFILALSLLFSLAACANPADLIENGIKGGLENGLDLPNSFESVTDFDGFADFLDQSDNRVSQTENEDGTVTVELTTPSKPTGDSDNTVKPAIPTIDNQPDTQPEKEEAKPQPDTDKGEEEKTPEKPAEPEVVPEPTPEPEVTPEPEPQPVKPSTPEKEEEPTVETYYYTTGQSHKKLNYTGRYLYSILDAEKKEWYRQIDKAVTGLSEEVAINANLGENRNYYIYFLYMADNPEHFYLANTVTILSNGDGTGGLLLTYSIGSGSSDTSGYGYGELTDALKARILAKKKTFENEVARILSTIPANAPDVWKERLIYDRILTDCYYNLSAKWDGLANDNWTAYGIIVNKYGVCESYSEAFQILCLYAGINCMGVVGDAGGGHKWNCVMLDGQWYMCDITFDDPIGGGPNPYHTYFNLTSEKMKSLNHNWDSCEWTVPNCTATKYSFANCF